MKNHPTIAEKHNQQQQQQHGRREESAKDQHLDLDTVNDKDEDNNLWTALFNDLANADATHPDDNERPTTSAAAERRRNQDQRKSSMDAQHHHFVIDEMNYFSIVLCDLLLDGCWRIFQQEEITATYSRRYRRQYIHLLIHFVHSMHRLCFDECQQQPQDTFYARIRRQLSGTVLKHLQALDRIVERFIAHQGIIPETAGRKSVEEVPGSRIKLNEQQQQLLMMGGENWIESGHKDVGGIAPSYLASTFYNGPDCHILAIDANLEFLLPYLYLEVVRFYGDLRLLEEPSILQFCLQQSHTFRQHSLRRLLLRQLFRSIMVSDTHQVSGFEQRIPTEKYLLRTTFVPYFFCLLLFCSEQIFPSDDVLAMVKGE